MMPVLKAEESLLAYQATACGVGPRSNGQKQQMKRQVREWVKTMQRFTGKPRPQRPSSLDDMRAVVSAMGIKVRGKGD